MSQSQYVDTNEFFEQKQSSAVPLAVAIVKAIRSVAESKLGEKFTNPWEVLALLVEMRKPKKGKELRAAVLALLRKDQSVKLTEQAEQIILQTAKALDEELESSQNHLDLSSHMEEPGVQEMIGKLEQFGILDALDINPEDLV